jgi:hypothetical protein
MERFIERQNVLFLWNSQQISDLEARQALNRLDAEEALQP